LKTGQWKLTPCLLECDAMLSDSLLHLWELQLSYSVIFCQQCRCSS